MLKQCWIMDDGDVLMALHGPWVSLHGSSGFGVSVVVRLDSVCRVGYGVSDLGDGIVLRRNLGIFSNRLILSINSCRSNLDNSWFGKIFSRADQHQAMAPACRSESSLFIGSHTKKKPTITPSGRKVT
jgi:hypothetical protein